ncbi:MAG: GrpB family protein [Limisphaerales bacterium]
METLEEKIARVVKEEVAIVPYDNCWPEMFERERLHLQSCLPVDLIKRIEHFGSTAVPGLSAKPIIDILVEVTSLEETKRRIVPLLEAQGYDYFWRPSHGDSTPPFYAWFIKRDENGNRTHHIHMVESQFEHWDRLLFRDYLIEHPDIAHEYDNLKKKLANAHSTDRVSYTQAKSGFISMVTEKAKQYYRLPLHHSTGSFEKAE